MNNPGLQLNIISAEKKLFSGIVSSVTVPGISGSLGFLPDHAPLITSLKEGTISYVVDRAEKTLDIKGGIVEVNNGVATICVL